jgi:four helix bundle protein
MDQPSAQRRRTLELQARVFAFASGVLHECPQHIGHIGAQELWRQLVRAAPSASNNLVEADEASSTADFIAKMKIALREAKEARNCLRFLAQSKLTPEAANLVALEDEARQISAIFATILIKVKKRYAAEQAAKKKTRKL